MSAVRFREVIRHYSKVTYPRCVMGHAWCLGLSLPSNEVHGDLNRITTHALTPLLLHYYFLGNLASTEFHGMVTVADLPVSYSGLGLITRDVLHHHG